MNVSNMAGIGTSLVVLIKVDQSMQKMREKNAVFNGTTPTNMQVLWMYPFFLARNSYSVKKKLKKKSL